MSFATRIKNISGFYLLNNKNKFFFRREMMVLKNRSMDKIVARKERDIETVKIFPMFLEIIEIIVRLH